jgi:hypothetical protein
MADPIDFYIAGGGTSAAGAIPLPLSAAFEHWLLARLPDELNSAGEWAVDHVVAVGAELAGGLRGGHGALELPTALAKRWGERVLTTDHLIGAMFMRGPIDQMTALVFGVLLGLVERRERYELRPLLAERRLHEVIDHRPLDLPPGHEPHARFCAALQISIETTIPVTLAG